MPTTLTASVQLDKKVHFVGQTDGRRTIEIDYPPPLGDGDGFTGLETLLLSLAGCSGTAVAGILQRMKQPVTGLIVRATGQRRDEHPTVLTDIDLEFVASGSCVDQVAVERAVKMAEKQLCPVWAMLKSGTPITWTCRVTE